MDHVGQGDGAWNGPVLLADGRVVAFSDRWNNGRGHTTILRSPEDAKGIVSEQNSLVGLNSTDGPQLVLGFADGAAMVIDQSFYYDDAVYKGAISPIPADGRPVGLVSTSNTVMHPTGSSYVPDPAYTYDTVNRQFVVGQMRDNMVTVWRFPQPFASISGRVITPEGRGLRSCTVRLIDNQSGELSTVTTSSFGYYTFDKVATDRSYTISIMSRQYRYQPLPLTVVGDMTAPDAVGLE